MFSISNGMIPSFPSNVSSPMSRRSRASDFSSISAVVSEAVAVSFSTTLSRIDFPSRSPVGTVHGICTVVSSFVSRRRSTLPLYSGFVLTPFSIRYASIEKPFASSSPAFRTSKRIVEVSPAIMLLSISMDSGSISRDPPRAKSISARAFLLNWIFPSSSIH